MNQKIEVRRLDGRVFIWGVYWNGVLFRRFRSHNEAYRLMMRMREIAAKADSAKGERK